MSRARISWPSQLIGRVTGNGAVVTPRRSEGRLPARTRMKSSDPTRLRLALVSSPRSGNTWLRHLLATTLGLEHLPIYDPWTADWERLPSRCVLMTHWHRTEAFVEMLRHHGFREVTLVRHPLDVLISILQYAPHNPETALWLGGKCGDERSIVGKTPRSQEFLRYATGARSKALLSVSRQWWKARGCETVRYEDLVRDTRGTLEALVRSVADEPVVPISEAIAAHTIERLRAREGPHHWKGRPGLWKSLLPADDARRIADAHGELFREYGYTCDPDEALSQWTADGTWAELTGKAERADNPR